MCVECRGGGWAGGDERGGVGGVESVDVLSISVMGGELLGKAIYFKCASCFIWYRPATEVDTEAV